MNIQRKKTIRRILCAAAVIAVLAAAAVVYPSIREKQCRTRVFEDMQTRVDEVEGSVIGILPKTTEADGTVTYGAGGSGVIFEREGDVYYALTAAHVVGGKEAEYLAYTAKTEYDTIDDPALDGIGMEIVDDSFYDTLSDITVEYVSPTADLAVVSFRSDDELTAARPARTELQKGDRIVCLGHPEGKSLTVSYGSVTSGLKPVTMTDRGTDRKATDTVLSHDAYLNPGSSGGPAFSEDMELVGINVGGAFDLLGRFRSGFLIPREQLDGCIAAWRTAAAQPVTSYAEADNWAYYGIGEDRAADLFLICPTVDMNDEYNMSLEDTDTRASFLGALNMERGIYEDSARMYAPYYRQAAMKVYGLEPEEREPYLALAYRDVSAAFSWYLAHENQGRPIILAGFSQGADLCYRLLEEYFSDEALYDRLVAVYALGWPCTEEMTEQYPQIRPAQGADDTGVVVSFDCEAPEVAETFINPAGQKAFAINPLNWRTDETAADRSENLGACFTDYEGRIQSEQAGLCGCYIDAARGVVKVTDIAADDYPAVVPGLPEGAYHVYDYLFFYRNLQQNAAERVESYMRANSMDPAA